MDKMEPALKLNRANGKLVWIGNEKVLGGAQINSLFYKKLLRTFRICLGTKEYF